jgi:membrane peptidoglycan carboxypeptidase
VTNREFPEPQRPGSRWEGRPGGAPSRGDGFAPRPRSSGSGYARASGTDGIGELDGYGRGGASGRSNGGSRSGQGSHAQRRPSRSARAGEPPSGGGASNGNGDSGYRPRRAAPGNAPGADRGEGRRGGSSPGGSGDGGQWDDRGGRPAQGRDRAASGSGRRDIRDDLRARLRRNGIAASDWDTEGQPRRRFGRGPGGGAGWDQTDGGGSRRWGRGGGGDGGDWDGPRGKAPRRKGSWWRHWSWKKVLGVVAAAFGVMVIFGAAGVAYAYSKATIPPIQTAVFQQQSKVYFSDGKTLVGTFGQTNRELLHYNQIPEVLVNAVVAAEDKNFWHEGGISPSGIIRAAYYDLTSSGGNLQGGSTITQQLVRNYYQGIGTAQTVSRKVDEIFVAEKLSQEKSKQWILEQYLNTIYLGDGAYGVGSAAQVYFGLTGSNLGKITPAQAAMIAAMIQQPSYYNPNPSAGQAYGALKFRWEYVLKAMQDMGTLSAQQYAQTKFPTLAPPPNNTWGGYKGYIMQAVQNELENNYNFSLTKINTGGLRIVTTFNENLMNSLYAAVRSNDKQMKQCAPGPQLAAAPRVLCSKLPHWVRTGAVLEKPGTGAILAMYSGPGYTRKGCKCQFDNALESRNQVGSSFKPYVLATAVQQGMNVQTSVLDGNSPLWIPPDSSPLTYAKQGTGGDQPAPGPGYYSVTNDESGGNSLGKVSVETATAASLNTAYTDLWHRVALNTGTGAHNVTNMAKAFGVDVQASGLTSMQDEAGIALGQASLTVEEQATTIATLANKGVYSTPHVILSITNGSQVIRARIMHRTVLTQAQAADVDWAMSFDTTAGGTADGLGLTNGQTVIGKTGTTNLAQSAFFMGATPKYAMAVGMFVNSPHCPKRLESTCTSQAALAYAPPPGLQTLFGVGGLPGYGGEWPASIWHTFFMNNFNSQAPVAFPPVNNDGTLWNLMGPDSALPTPHHHQDHGGGGGGKGCQPGQLGFPFGHCHHNSPPPTPPPTPTPNPTPTATPTGRPTGFPQANTRAAVSGSTMSGGTGAWALAAVVIVGPMLSVTGRLRDRRRRSRANRAQPPGS